MSSTLEIMEILFKRIERWIFRDAFYCLGGVILVHAVLLALNAESTIPKSSWGTVIVILAGYAIGYVATEIMGMTIFARTAVSRRPYRITVWLLRQHWPGYEYKTHHPSNWLGWERLLSKCLSQPLQSAIDRVNMLKHLTVSLGANLLLAFPFLLIWGIRDQGASGLLSGWLWAIALLMSFIFLILSRIHLYHEHDLEVAMAREVNEAEANEVLENLDSNR